MKTLVNIDKICLQVYNLAVSQLKSPILQGKLMVLHLKIIHHLRQLIRVLCESSLTHFHQ